MSNTINHSAAEALHNRAKQLVLTMAWLGKAKELSFAQGALCELGALLGSEGPAFLAARDASMGGYQPHTGFKTAWAALPAGAENFTLAEVQKFLAGHGIEVSTDVVTHGNAYAAAGLKDSEVTALPYGHDEHGSERAELKDGRCLHVLTRVESAIVAQGGVSEREQRLINALTAIVRETMDYPPVAPSSSDSYLPSKMVEAAMLALARYDVCVPMVRELAA